jgi:2-polyprenyl-3-methyl-5-hydroxy-6-metoxy-1,4-benzoquinol methylase
MRRNDRPNVNTQTYMYSDMTNALVEDLKGTDLKDISVLDIGCASGNYLYGVEMRLAKEFPDLNVTLYGLDISDSMVAKGREKYPHFKLFNNNIHDFVQLEEIKQTKWTYIITNHTLEHIDNIDKVIPFFIEHTKRIFYVIVPYENFIDNHEHIYYFSRNSFDNFGKSVDYKLVGNESWKVIFYTIRCFND